MALSDKWLKAHYNKTHDKLITKTDRDSMGVRVTPAGKVIFQLRYRYNGKQDRMDLGTYPAMSLKEARLAALEARDQLAQGHNPKLLKRARIESNRSAMNLREFIEAFYKGYCIENQKSHEQIFRSYELHVFPKLGDIPIEHLTLHNWLELLEPMAKDKPSIAGRILTNTKQALKWGTKRQMVQGNVLSDITWNDLGIERGIKDRILSDVEIKYLFGAMDNSDMLEKNKILIKLCLFFACRNGELRSAKVEHFDFDNNIWTVPPENHKIGEKTKRPLKRPFNDDIKMLICKAITINNGSDYVFTNEGSTDPMGKSSTSSFARYLERHIKRLFDYDMPLWSVHDLRRTARTNFSSLAEPHVAEVMVGHRLPGAVREVYDRYEYIEEQRLAYDKWWARIQVILNGENVVEFKKLG
ncbi:tyrosine-type recombinase/integrase [Vibrio astriarenae]|uniref:tyrosine-type recombinase/integrase n=1 Tax=Vibrio astriarenae TaxID=1481923 RepID=UPI0037355077